MSWPSMKVLRPATVSGSVLTSSNVQEVPPAAYNSGTTYALNATATVYSGVNNTTADVYQSLQNGNTNHAPASSPSWWKKIGSTYAQFVLAGPIGAGYINSARVIDATAHLVYESLIDGNMSPLADTGAWAEVGPTNKWAMFDQSNSTASTSEIPIVVTLAPAGRIDCIALFGLQASSVRIQSATSGYDQTFDLTETSGIDDWYDWFFEPIERKDQLVVDDLPPYLNQTLTITISNGSGAVSVGTLLVGQNIDLGMTLADADAGILSYSKIDVNQWGDYALTQRKSVKKVSLQVVVENADVDKVRRILAGFDAVPTAWQGSGEYSALSLYGIYRNFSIAFSYPTQSVCSLELEGLT